VVTQGTTGRAEDDTGTPVYHFIAVVSLRQPCCQTKTPFEVDSTNSETTRWNTGIKKGLSLPSDNDERNTYWDKEKLIILGRGQRHRVGFANKTPPLEAVSHLEQLLYTQHADYRFNFNLILHSCQAVVYCTRQSRSIYKN